MVRDHEAGYSGGLRRGDQKTRYDAYASARQWGWMSTKGIRQKEDLSPIEGGDTYLEPLNMTADA